MERIGRVTGKPQSDVIVIGGGLAGCATAYYLASGGANVTLIERHDLNTLASGSNAGSLHAQIPYHEFTTNGPDWAERYAPVIGLLMRSIELWRDLPAVLETDLGVALRGGVLAASSEAGLRAVERKVAIERAQGLDVRMVDRAALLEIAPYLADHVIGGSFCPDEGKADPFKATPAFAAAAARLGATIVRLAAVTAIEREADGGFSVTSSKGSYRARRLVNAAGADAGRIAAMLGGGLPDVQAFPIQVSATEPVGQFLPHLVYNAGDRLTLKQNAIGSVLIGGGWPARPGANGVPFADPRSLRANLAVACRLVPSLASIRVVRTWAAYVNGTEDWKPILGEMPSVPGCFVVFFPWMGFTAGPIVGRIVASQVLGQRPPVDMDLAPFAPQ